MDEKLIKELIRLLQKTPKPSSKALVILTGASNYQEFCCDHLADLSLELFYCLSAEYIEEAQQPNLIAKLGKQICGFRQIEQSISNCDFVLIPDMTTEFLTKGALCIADTDGLYALQQALLMEKNIWTLIPEFLSKEKKTVNKNNYFKMFAYYQEILERLGVEFIESIQLKSTIETAIGLTVSKESVQVKPKNGQMLDHLEEHVLSGFITYEDVVNKKQVTLAKHAKLTELAKDHITNNQIKINYSN
ncbi:hypothetical protein DOK67_0002869 [Enterococcus sp. DIV0212c]|uniref:hypothetical protein n=1 Tax=Enterococcus sp. DIV0212c TaxID=2230867 RepID=UPI001A9B39C6|nr:hypothetical protein [Enterococcus sp. DIV0212c]MBO1354403.1 hypothetical protein [Enterococcus sp. DIV0212c]